ncbi:hypothetical protein llap_15417 [Limosa lapponica baueri]|uniref:Rna-directed dna polymerase from mobile element jockey-like n=1 Tax=Limosa lapponica baueri TaxID=1758121 RepID=A0A2I0TKE6_LIMLA|nr:hypothetical protein llap_15417 [Limosa lapponica baueri]
MERTHTGTVHEELQPVGGTHVGEGCGLGARNRTRSKQRPISVILWQEFVADKAFFKQLEELYRSQIKGNKSFCYHFNSKRLNKEKVSLLLNEAGDLVTVDIDEAEVLNAFLASVFIDKVSWASVLRDRVQGKLPTVDED